MLVFITDLGDTAVLGAVSLTIAGYLAWRGQWRAAAVLMWALLGAGLGIGVLKVAFLGCGASIGDAAIRSPSGHSALSAAVFGTLAVLVADRFAGWRRAIPYLIAAALAGAVGLSRALLGMHSRDEVIAGLLVGAGVALLSRAMLRRCGPISLEPPVLAAQALVVMLALDGTRLPIEIAVRRVSGWFHQEAPFCRDESADFRLPVTHRTNT